MPEKRNQHTVSEFYLYGFTPDVGDRVLWEYSRTAPDRPQTRTYRKATAEDYFYSEQEADGTWDHSLEDAMGDAETMSAPAFTRLIGNQQLQTGDRQLVAQFMALTIMRTKLPRNAALPYHAILESPEFARDLVTVKRDELIAKHGIKKFQEFCDDTVGSGKGLAVPKNPQLIDVFDRANRIGALIMQMAWTIWKAKPPSLFITSDNPVFARDPARLKSTKIEGIGAHNANVELGFPLSPRLFLIADWKGGPELSYKVASGPRILALNTRTVLSATEHVYSQTKSQQVQSLVKQHQDFKLNFFDFTPEQLRKLVID